MKYSKRLELFERVRAEYIEFLTAVLWKLAADRELFTEALQYALMDIWKAVEKLTGKGAGSYIYRIALTANAKAWRNRIGKDGHVAHLRISVEKDPPEKLDETELLDCARQAIAKLPTKQAKAIVMRYLEQKDYRAIADCLGSSEESARSNVSKALAKLKHKLAGLIEG